MGPVLNLDNVDKFLAGELTLQEIATSKYMHLDRVLAMYSLAISRPKGFSPSEFFCDSQPRDGKFLLHTSIKELCRRVFGESMKAKLLIDVSSGAWLHVHAGWTNAQLTLPPGLVALVREYEHNQNGAAVAFYTERRAKR